MTQLIQIGNSRGIRIPKPFIEKINLENVEIDLEIVDDGILIKPKKNQTRKGWQENISKTLKKYKFDNDDALLEEMLNDSDLEVWEW
ncbi:MAG: AbrB/MazE/SpoVT family DNA-binding domain-containing protein [Candidatus Marinimicrobia bacterium]|nr:AbrB/MazE/SpoVT family DNA-binding domain-containing protein [Candidatus Neomarinimicrobiota bacterium]